MTTTPVSLPDESLGESWVDVTRECLNMDRVSPLLLTTGFGQNSDMHLMLREAQRESNQTSRASSEKSPSPPKSPPRSLMSPATPPRSPASDLFNDDVDDLQDLIINHTQHDHTNEIEDDPPIIEQLDWVWQYSSLPTQEPPKEWKFKHPTKTCLSVRHSKVMKRGLFSAEVLSLVMLTNLVSLLLGAGLGFYIGKRLGTGVVSSLD